MEANLFTTLHEPRVAATATARWIEEQSPSSAKIPVLPNQNHFQIIQSHVAAINYALVLAPDFQQCSA
jgi:hypothetical protein